MPPEPEAKTLIDFIQDHEREWGKESYTGRPGLAEMLKAKVVAFWEQAPNPNKPDKTETREFITLHESTVDIEEHIKRLVFRIGMQLPERRLTRVFEDGAKLRIKDVKIVFEKVVGE